MNLQVDPKRPETFAFSEVAVKGWLKYVSNGNDFWWNSQRRERGEGAWGPFAEVERGAEKGEVRYAHPLNAWAQLLLKSGQISYA